MAARPRSEDTGLLAKAVFEFRQDLIVELGELHPLRKLSLLKNLSPSKGPGTGIWLIEYRLRDDLDHG